MAIPAVSSAASTNYAPEEYDIIAITATVSNSPSNVVCVVNSKVLSMSLLNSTTYTTGQIPAAKIGVCSAQTITVIATNADGGSQANASSTLTVTAETDNIGVMRERRNIVKSLKAYLSTEIGNQWSDITVQMGWKQAGKPGKPVVCITHESTETVRREMGNTAIWDTHMIAIDIFADRSWGQAQDIADFIKDEIRRGWPYYIYSHNDSNAIVSTESGRVNVRDFLRDEAVPLTENMTEAEKYRYSIVFVVRKT